MRQIRLMLWTLCAAVAGTGFTVGSGRAADAEPVPQVDFRGDVWPTIKEKCLGCHNPQKRQGALDMSSRTAMLEGGHSGAALVPGNVEKSLMIELIEFDEMPPRKQKKQRVTEAELKKLRAWIAAGAVIPDDPGPPPRQ